MAEDKVTYWQWKVVEDDDINDPVFEKTNKFVVIDYSVIQDEEDLTKLLLEEGLIEKENVEEVEYDWEPDQDQATGAISVFPNGYLAFELRADKKVTYRKWDVVGKDEFGTSIFSPTETKVTIDYDLVKGYEQLEKILKESGIIPIDEKDVAFDYASEDEGIIEVFYGDEIKFELR